MSLILAKLGGIVVAAVLLGGFGLMIYAICVVASRESRIRELKELEREYEAAERERIRIESEDDWK